MISRVVSNDEIFESVELIDFENYKDSFKQNSVNKKYNPEIPGYVSFPKDNFNSFKEFKESFIKECEECKEKFSENSKNLENIRTIFCGIDYPLTNIALLKFTVKKDVNITNLVILYAYSIAYKLVYLLEDDDVGGPTGTLSPTMLNRSTSNGRFGIWGHYIENLIYNGYSNVFINENEIFAHFSCDS